MQELIDYLKALHDNNDREWFHAHHAEWKRLQKYFAAFTGELIAGIASFDPAIAGLEVKDCSYRIARDTRFSKDKTPYKTWIGTFIATRGKKAGYAGYYFHVEPDGEGMIGGCMLSAGIVCAEPVVLRSIREEIVDNGAEIVKAVKASGFGLAEGNPLKRTPVGFASGSEFDELLRKRDLYLEKRVPESFMLDGQLLRNTVDEFRRTQPFIALLNRAVQYAHEEMM